MPNGYAYLDWNGLPRIANDGGVSADAQPARAEPGEATGVQRNYMADMGAFGSPYPNGGNCNNPCGFPRYGSLYTGSYQTYDWMLRHPVITIARSQLLSPIESAPFAYEPRDKAVPQEWVDLVKGQVEDIRGDFMEDVMSGPDYGWAGFEKVWKADGGRYVLECLKPLHVATTNIVTDKAGRYAGLLPDGRSDPVKDALGVHKSFLFTHNRRFGNLYGLSQLERCRETAWAGWLDTATEFLRMMKKLAGIMPVIYTPSGSRLTSTGETVPWATSAANILRGARNGDGIHLTHFGTQSPVASVNNFDQLIALIKASAVRLEVIDFGSNAPALATLLETLRSHEERMFAAFFQSPRTGMATEGGTKADAGQHTDTATINSENIAARIAQAFNRGVVNDILTLNFGEAARGSVRVVPGKLTDDNLATDTQALTALHADPELGGPFRQAINFKVIGDRRSIPWKNPEAKSLNLEPMEPDPEDDLDGTPGDNDKGKPENDR